MHSLDRVYMGVALDKQTSIHITSGTLLPVFKMKGHSVLIAVNTLKMQTLSVGNTVAHLQYFPIKAIVMSKPD